MKNATASPHWLRALLASAAGLYIACSAQSASGAVGTSTVAPRTANKAHNTFHPLVAAAEVGSTFGVAVQQTFATGTSPFSVAVGDINGDGKPDLIVANYGDNTISVLLNTTLPGAASPTFAAQQTFSAGASPQSVTIADVNGDGKPDVIVSNNVFSGSVSVLLNTTTPGATAASFAAPLAFVTGAGPYSVTAVDLNGDGMPDLVVASTSNGTVSVLLNTTTKGATSPSFAVQQTFPVGVWPDSIAAADINGDGKADLVVANSVDGTISVLLNTTAAGTGSASFAAQEVWRVGAVPRSVITVDINGDGQPDVVVANSDGTMSVLINTTMPGAATSSFAAQEIFATSAVAVTAADLNGDGKPDLIVTSFVDGSEEGTALVLLNTTVPGAGTASFVAQQAFDTGLYPVSVTTADINGDSRPDLIVANFSSNTVSVLLNTPASITIDGYMSGNWFNPEQSGHGFQIEATNAIDSATGKPIALAIWFVYAPDGDSQNWIYAQGTYDKTSNNVTLPAVLNTGARFPPNFSSSAITQTSWGELTFNFTDCNHGTVTWSSPLPGYGMGSMPISRLTQIAGTTCPP